MGAKLDSDYLKAIRNEVLTHIEDGATTIHQPFKDFWADIDVINAYEDGLQENIKHWKPYFRAIWEELQPNSIKYIKE